MDNTHDDPFTVLGLPHDADPQLIRQTYLNLVKQFPPDKAPDKFRQIHHAYQMLDDPLAQANAIMRLMNEKVSLDDAIQQASKLPARLPTRNLLALGNLSS